MRIKALLLAIGLAAAPFTPSEASFVNTLGNNPNSATGHFSNSVLGTTFTDDFTFTLTGSPQFVAFASATNDFAGVGLYGMRRKRKLHLV